MRKHPVPTGLHRALQPPIPLLDLILSTAPARPGTLYLQQLVEQEAVRCRMAQLHQEGSRDTEILKRSWIAPLPLSQKISTGTEVLETCLLSHPSCAAMSQDTF